MSWWRCFRASATGSSGTGGSGPPGVSPGSSGLSTPAAPAEPEATPRLLLALCSAVALGLTLAQILGPLGGVPHVQDEQAYLIQARLFADGARTAPASPLGLGVAMEFQELTPRWYAVFPPGWPAVLSLGVALGAPALVNPLLAASLPWLVWAALRRWIGGGAATLAAVLVALSPGVLLLGGSWMSHTLTLALALGGLAALGAAMEGGEGADRGAALAGLCVGGLVLTRPWDAALLGGPAIALAAGLTARGRWRPGRLLAFGLGPALAVLLLGLDNRHLTGSPWVFPVDAYFDWGADWGERWRPGCNRLGIGPGHGCASYMERGGYTLAMAWRGLRENALAFDRLLLGFSGGGLLVVLGLPALARRAPGLILPLVLVPLGYALYWYHGISYGPRFWHGVYLTALPALALALRGLAARLRAKPALAVAPALFGLLWAWPGLQRELGEAYWCVDDTLAGRLERAGVSEGLVLLDDQGQARRFWPQTKLDGMLCGPSNSAGAGLARNDPWGEAALTWARWPEGEALEAALDGAGERPVWRVLRDLSTGAAWLSRWDPLGRAWSDPAPLPGSEAR